ncbi:hypothetical protein GLYMA_17G004600v4 [Glycine max]|uniref:Uncharacterized protein n=1 Tax=Glycine max TaxID=3847 RepID=A0A0R0F6G2_SOYBN|nr:hypothetical protein JHK86_046103 [Glycine max]KAG4941997.1 hypothetical protein JHK85_046643 [Glycine max]KAH1116077.1 hypothetical protein GYH30_045814 [Glycine max]KRH01933.1 hypothetical protein GLYMA_17G004600v4 [Glycine max]
MNHTEYDLVQFGKFFQNKYYPHSSARTGIRWPLSKVHVIVLNISGAGLLVM